MLIQHIGHAEFLLVTESGYQIVTDPYDASCGYPIQKIEADAVLVSHHHHDHDAVENVTGDPRIVDTAGNYTLCSDVRMTALEAFHDDAQGSKRGKTLLFILESEGLKIAHLGDLGDDLTAELNFINAHKQNVCRFELAALSCNNHTGRLRHGFNLQNAGHNRIVRKMALKKRFVDGYVL